MSKILHGDSKEVLKTLDAESIDALICDPPYALGFMGKAWDKALPDIEIFRECFRVMKPGAFAFVMSAPRSDVCARMMLLLEDAGFEIGFTPIYWTYASGFPKAMNIGKMVDKRAGVAREVIGTRDTRVGRGTSNTFVAEVSQNTEVDITIPSTTEAKALDGSYGGFQPKPAVEVVIVAMKPLSEKTYVDQALKEVPCTLCGGNGSYPAGYNSVPAPVMREQKCGKCGGSGKVPGMKGVTWLDDCRIPIVDDDPNMRPNAANHEGHGHTFGDETKTNTRSKDDLPDRGFHNSKGRFPANLLVENSILDTIECTCTNEGNTQIAQEDLNSDEAGIEATIPHAGQHPKTGSAESPKPSKGNGSPTSIAPLSPLHASLFTTSEDGSHTEAQTAIAPTVDGCEPSENATETSAFNAKQPKTSTSTTSSRTRASLNSSTKSATVVSCALHATGRPTPTASSQQYSRFFDLDAWAKTLPFLIVPKASKSEKNEGLTGFPPQKMGRNQSSLDGGKILTGSGNERSNERQNHHPTVKPLKLMSYLITLGSRPGDTVLDPFLGSGTTAVAAKMLGRECVGIEREDEYVKIAEARLAAVPAKLL